MKQSIAMVDSSSKCDLKTAISKIKSMPEIKFDQSVDIAIRVDVDHKKFGHLFRSVVSLPHGLGKPVKVAVICSYDQIESAKAAGADMVGAEDLIEHLKNNGAGDFDVIIAHISLMPTLSKIAKVLKSLMPSIKSGTATDNVILAIQSAKRGQCKVKMSEGGVIHAPIGKLSFSIESLTENFRAIADTIKKCKVNNKDPVFKSLFISATMSPSVDVELSEIRG